MKYLSSSQIKKASDLLNYYIATLADRAVQTCIITNDSCVTIELSVNRDTYEILSVCLFPWDFERKYKFIEDTIIKATSNDTYNTICEAIKQYKKRYKF